MPFLWSNILSCNKTQNQIMQMEESCNACKFGNLWELMAICLRLGLGGCRNLFAVSCSNMQQFFIMLIWLQELQETLFAHSCKLDVNNELFIILGYQCRSISFLPTQYVFVFWCRVETMSLSAILYKYIVPGRLFSDQTHIAYWTQIILSVFSEVPYLCV